MPNHPERHFVARGWPWPQETKHGRETALAMDADNRVREPVVVHLPDSFFRHDCPEYDLVLVRADVSTDCPNDDEPDATPPWVPCTRYDD